MKIHELMNEEVSKQFIVFRTNNFVICISQLVSLRWWNEGRYTWHMNMWQRQRFYTTFS